MATNSLKAILFSRTNAVIVSVPPVNTVPPMVATQVPLRGSSLTNLTNITVAFSEPVQHVDAADLLVNGVAATGVSGGGSNYTFTFPRPAYGEVNVAWAANHGISDFGYIAVLPFDGSGSGSQWGYYLFDQTPPTLSGRIPAAGSIVTNLTQISVSFSELGQWRRCRGFAAQWDAGPGRERRRATTHSAFGNPFRPDERLLGANLASLPGIRMLSTGRRG